jgi:hypothetical protein
MEKGLETGDGATAPIDATVRFFEEFMFKEKMALPMQQSPQQATGSEDDGAKKEHIDRSSLSCSVDLTAAVKPGPNHAVMHYSLGCFRSIAPSAPSVHTLTPCYPFPSNTSP